MRPEQQYIDLYAQAEAMLRSHSTEAQNRLRARAFADFERLILTRYSSVTCPT